MNHFCPKMCGKSYKAMFTLNRHMKYECGVDPQFKCMFCSKPFTIKGNMKRHLILVHKYV